MSAPEMTCDVCNGESGGKFVGVAAMVGQPMSLAWCDACLDHDAVPEWNAEYLIVAAAEGDLDQLAPWVRQHEVWLADKKEYVGFEQWVEMIDPEKLKRQAAAFSADYDKAMRGEEVAPHEPERLRG